jgi:hypothetical protein
VRTPGQGVPREILQSGGTEDVRIYSLAPDDAYCASGWHVISLNYIDAVDFYPGKEAMFASFNAVDESFQLDGVPLASQRTAIKASPANLGPTGLHDVYWFGTGTLLPPGSLAVGTHQVQTTVIDPTYGNDIESAQFKVIAC